MLKNNRTGFSCRNNSAPARVIINIIIISLFFAAQTANMAARLIMNNFKNTMAEETAKNRGKQTILVLHSVL